MRNNKKKIKHLGFNLIWHITSLIFPFSILFWLTELNVIWVVAISLYIYINDVKRGVDNDFFENEIKILNEKIK